jgi:SAM-dependent methyltransferase
MPNSDPMKTISERLAMLGSAPRWNPRRAEIMRDLQALMATVDSPRLDALRSQYEDRIRKASADSRYKYLDVVFYTWLKLQLAGELHLNEGPPKRILDIGTAAGHFPFVCRFFGHQVVGIDIENPVYEGIAACLGFQRTIVRVEPSTPLPDLGGRFDLITACNITFNEKRNPHGPRLRWSLAEWQFFLDDLVANHLRYPGVLYLQLNEEPHGRLLGFDRLAYDRELLAMAARNGAVVNRRRGTIKMSFASRREIR